MMDSLTLYLKTLLCDLPVEDYILMSQNKKERECKFCQVARWNEQKFTLSQLKSLYCDINDRLKDDKKIAESLNKDNDWFNIFYVVLNYANSCINFDNEIPRVKLSKMFHWQNITKYLGQDIFTTIYAAFKDNKIDEDTLTFAWPDVIDFEDGEDCVKISDVLSQGIADVHAHLNATAAVADIRWIMLMNRPQDKIIDMGLLQKIVTTSWSTYHFPIKDLVKIAAYLRYFLWQHKDKDGKEEIPEILRKWHDEQMVDPSRIFGLVNDIISLRGNSLKLNSDDGGFDYALTDKVLNDKQLQINSPFALLQGERILFYDFFNRLFMGKVNSNLIQMMHLYILIKSRIRQEFVQSNNIEGLDNFQRYDGNRCQIKDKTLLEIYAVQSSIRYGKPDYLEARAAYNDDLRLEHKVWSTNLLKDRDGYNCKEIKRGLTIVATITKSKSPKGYDAKCEKARAKMINIVDRMQNQECDCVQVTGIDTLGGELNARPEIFRLAYEYAHCNGIQNLTYHCGEDFYDLVDGLRAIDEAVTFLQLGKGSRLGHALALGIDARRYYERRYYISPMPRQYAIDNYAWLYSQLKETCIHGYAKELNFLEKEFYSLMPDRSVDINDYVESMKIRGLKNVEGNYDEKVVDLYDNYKRLFSDSACISVHWNRRIVRIIDFVQRKLHKKIATKRISIESCPSSNLSIGPIDRYDEHPMLKISRRNPCERAISISINTDDRGIFATSLPQEYALMALAMRKARNAKGSRVYSDKQVLKFIKRRIADSKEQRFKYCSVKACMSNKRNK